METAKRIQKKSQIAYKNDLYSICYSVFQLPGTVDLSPRERRYLFFLISLVRSGYSEIRAPMAVIADSIFRCQGQTASVSTLRTAIAELERRGYLTRRTFRVGPDRGRTVIEIHTDRFVFWTKISVQNISPLPTQSHISSCHQDLVGDDRKISSSVVNSQYSSDKRNNRSNTGARCNNSAKKNHAYHPIVYTLLCVLPRSPQRASMIDLARREISTGDASDSGVDWPYYTKLWPALDPAPGGRRENTAKREIVPLLWRALEGDGRLSQAIPVEPDMPRCEIRDLIERSMAPVSAVPEPESEPVPVPEKTGTSLDREEFSVLRAAKNSLKNKG